MKRTIEFLLCCTFLLAFTCCKQSENQIIDENYITLTQAESSPDNLDFTKHCQYTNKRILVIFGYDFNSPELTKEFLSLLSDRYGLDEDNGLIYPLIYPNDFKHGSKSYVSDLASIMHDENLDIEGVIILGAPERTHSAFARNQDKWNQEVPYPVIALFPQDDVLGLESTCDFVLDKGQQAGITGEINSEEVEGQLISEAPEVLIETIDYIQKLCYSLSKDSKLQTHLMQMLKGRKFHHYTDPETGLQSINHFVLN